MLATSTIYSIVGGRTEVFSSEITGPNGVMLSPDERTVSVSTNIDADTSKLATEQRRDTRHQYLRSDHQTLRRRRYGRRKEGTIRLTCCSPPRTGSVPTGKALATITIEQKALVDQP